jgi:hypothetical protein
MSHPDPSRREDFERATLYAESRSIGHHGFKPAVFYGWFIVAG